MNTAKMVTMRLHHVFINKLDESAKRLGVSKTRALEGALLGLTAEQIDEAFAKGVSLLDNQRQDSLNQRKAIKERLKNLSTEQLEKLLNDGAA